MSIWSTLHTSSSGIQAYGNAMGVVGDNVANVGTTGFKGGRAGFSAILGGIGHNQVRAGNGVVMSGAQTGFGQGSLQQTGRNKDMAVWGAGFFVLQGAHLGTEGQYYSRDGRFDVDLEGKLVNPDGMRVQGFMATGVDGERFSPTMTDIDIPEGIAPQATSELMIQAQLDPNDGTPANYESSVTIYDSLGVAHNVTLRFEATGSGGWTVTPSDESGLPLGASHTIEFDGNGNLTSGTIGSFPFTNPDGSTQLIAMDFSGSTQWDGGSAMTYDKDGNTAGQLQDIQVSEDGTIQGIYSNGESQAVGRLALADFTAEGSLQRTGSQLFRETPNSGAPSIGWAGTAGRGTIRAGAVEGSNVDLGNELVTMITYQRAFQANARAVTTADEMLSETANLKR